SGAAPLRSNVRLFLQPCSALRPKPQVLRSSDLPGQALPPTIPENMSAAVGFQLRDTTPAPCGAIQLRFPALRALQSPNRASSPQSRRNREARALLNALQLSQRALPPFAGCAVALRSVWPVSTC